MVEAKRAGECGSGCNARIDDPLLAVPVIVSCNQMVPSSQINAALWNFGRGHEFGMCLATDVPNMRLCEATPHLVDFDQAIRVQRLIARKVAGDFGRDVLQRVLRSMAQTKANGNRSSDFLRYLIGLRIDDERQVGDAGGEKCKRIEDKVGKVMARRLGLPCSVEARTCGTFFEALYTGMWRYQMKRIDFLTRRISNGSARYPGLRAKLSLQGQLHEFWVRIGFFIDGISICGRDYVLRSRPSEDLARCISRIRDRIEASGIQTVVCERSLQRSTSMVDFDMTQGAPGPIALPI